MNELSEISALVKEYISPETVWLVPCLYALGSIIKRSIRIDDTLIPSRSAGYNGSYLPQ